MMLYKQENMVSVIHEDKYKPSIDGTFLPIKTQWYYLRFISCEFRYVIFIVYLSSTNENK